MRQLTIGPTSGDARILIVDDDPHIRQLLVFALEKAGLTYADITPVYLTPPDAGEPDAGARASTSSGRLVSGGSFSSPRTAVENTFAFYGGVDFAVVVADFLRAG